MEKSTLSTLLLGPELIWILLGLLSGYLARLNAAPPHSLDKMIEQLYLWVPLAVLLTFLLWYIPAVEKNWLLLRVWIACIIGGHIVLNTGMKGYSEQGPGIGTAYIVGIGLNLVALIAGTVFVKIRF